MPRTILAIRLPGNPRTKSERFSLYTVGATINPLVDDSVPYAVRSTHPTLPPVHFRLKNGESLLNLSSALANHYGQTVRLQLLDGFASIALISDPEF